MKEFRTRLKTNRESRGLTILLWPFNPWTVTAELIRPLLNFGGDHYFMAIQPVDRDSSS